MQFYNLNQIELMKIKKGNLKIELTGSKTPEKFI